MSENALATALSHQLMVLRLKYLSETYDVDVLSDDEDETQFFRPWEMGEAHAEVVQRLYHATEAHMRGKFPSEDAWSTIDPQLIAHMQKDHATPSHTLRLNRLEYLYNTDVVLVNPQSLRPVDYSAWMNWTKAVPVFIEEAYNHNIADLTEEETPDWTWVDALMTPFVLTPPKEHDAATEDNSRIVEDDLPIATILDRLEFLGQEFGHIFFPDGSLRKFRRADAENEDEEDVRECYRLNLESFGQNAPQDWSMITVAAYTPNSDEDDDPISEIESTQTAVVENSEAPASTTEDQSWESEEFDVEEEEEEEEDEDEDHPTALEEAQSEEAQSEEAQSEEAIPTNQETIQMNTDDAVSVQFDTPTLINHTFTPRTHETVYIVVNEEKTAVVSACNTPLGALEYRVVSLPNKREVIATQLENAALFYSCEDAQGVADQLQNADPKGNYTVHTLVRKQIVYYALENA